MYTVYKHTNVINGKTYIGQTCLSVENRWRNGKGYKTGIFKAAIAKYGWDSFKHDIVKDKLTKEEASALEKKLIMEYKILGLSYNITDGGEGCVGYKHSDEIRAKMSSINKGKKFPEYLKDLVSRRFKDKPLTEIHKKRISAALIGKPKSDIAKANMRANHVYHDLVAIIKCDLEGNEICTYQSIAEASRDTGVKQTHITRCARGKRPTAGGYKWIYKENETI